jgi:hypothetical protein
MKKVIVIALLITSVSTSALAEWTFTGGGGLNYDLYVDYGSIRKNGNKVKMWEMQNFKTLQEAGGVKYLSAASQYEYDCQEETMGQIAIIAYEENMAVTSVSHDEFVRVKTSPVPPNSIAMFMWKIACGRE